MFYGVRKLYWSNNSVPFALLAKQIDQDAVKYIF